MNYRENSKEEDAMCGCVLQCDAVCCSMLQFDAVCCHVLTQRVYGYGVASVSRND